MEPARFDNDFKLSSTKFHMNGLEQFTLMLDNVVQEGYPLKIVNYGESKFYHMFYLLSPTPIYVTNYFVSRARGQ